MHRIARSPARLLFVASMCLATQAWGGASGHGRAAMAGASGQGRAARAARAGARTAEITVASADRVAPGAPLPPAVPRCAAAAIKDIPLPARTAVDEIRVVVARGSPQSGAADIRVGTGRFDRVLRVRGSGARALTFTPALTGSAFRVSLDPVFEADRGACVDRVELLRGGKRVAVVHF